MLLLAEKLKCSMCDFSTGYRSNLKRHKLVKHGIGGKPGQEKEKEMRYYLYSQISWGFRDIT